MANNSADNLDNNLFYNDNYINNYEEMACCSNNLFSNLLQENATNILNYINDLCFNNVSLNEDAQIVNDPNKKIETPLCSNNKNKNEEDNNKENINIGNNTNNTNNIQTNNIIKKLILFEILLFSVSSIS